MQTHELVGQPVGGEGVEQVEDLKVRRWNRWQVEEIIQKRYEIQDNDIVII